MAVARAMAGSLAVGDEHARAQEALSGGLTLMAQAVVKMFRSDNGGGWQEVGGPGMLVYCANSSGVQWVKVVQLSDGAQLLNEELYEDFNRTYASDGRAAQMACHTEINQQRPKPKPKPKPNPNPHPHPHPNPNPYPNPNLTRPRPTRRRCAPRGRATTRRTPTTAARGVTGEVTRGSTATAPRRGWRRSSWSSPRRHAWAGAHGRRNPRRRPWRRAEHPRRAS